MKNQIKQIGFKTLAVLLSLLMIFYVLPSTVYAEWFEGGGEQTVSAEPEIVKKEVFELTDRREESVKHFRLEDGSIMAVQYADAVHRADENGTWQDIDNTLSSKRSEFTTSDARVKFAKKIMDDGLLFTLQENGRAISMNLNGAKKKTAGAVTNKKTEFEKSATQLQKLMTLDKLSSKILYADILDGVDLEYVVVSNDIKENIIVKERKESYTYSFTISLNDLEAALTEIGSVVILDPETRETIYVIPAPIVYDANGAYASVEDAFYSLEQSENNTYSLSVTVNPEWMNNEERSFPVVVDPTISVQQATVVDLDISSDYPSSNTISSSTLSVSNTTRAYWKTNNLPNLPVSAYIVSASIGLTWDLGGENYIGVYQVLTDWDTSLNWNKVQATPSEGQLSTAPLDYQYTLDDGNGEEDVRFTWDITGLVKEWYSGTSSNYGVGFAPIASTSVSGASIFYSNNVYIASNRPQFSIVYKDMKGVEPYWSFSSQNAGLAGTGYINRATGSLTLTKGLLSTTDSLFPYTPTLVYSSSLVTTVSNATQLRLWSYPYAQTASQNSYLPLGFKWNMQETLIKKAYKKPDGSSSEFFIWSDADGTEHYFLPVGNSTTEYADEDGLQLKLFYNDDNNEERYFLTDDSKTIKKFTEMPTNPGNDVLESWYLTQITDKNGNEISFAFNNALQPTEICLTPKGSTKITFLKILYTNGLPYVIWNEVSKDAVVFRYLAPDIDNLSPSDAMFLQQLDYAHGNANTTTTDWLNYYNNGTTANITVDGTVSYTYDAYGYLTEAKDDVSDYRVSYTYSNGKVASVKEYGQNTTLGQEIQFNYYNGYMEVRTSGNDDLIGNTDDLITRYTFDREGRAVGVYTTDITKTQIYGGSAGTYETEDRIKNNIKESVTVGGSATNYLLNGGIETRQSLYAAAPWIPSSNRVTFSVPETGYSESGGISFHIQANTTDSVAQYTQLPAGTYTLSMNVNALNCRNVNAYIIAESMNRNYTFTEEIPLNEYNDNIHSFVSATFDAGNYNSNGTENFIIRIQVVGGNSLSNDLIFKINQIMLEENIGNSNYSMIQYGNFEPFSINSSGTVIDDMTNYWEDDGNGFARWNVGDPFGNAGYLSGSITNERYLKQTFYRADAYTLLHYDNNDPDYFNDSMTFTVSGFAKGIGQVASVNSTFRIRVDVNYYMGSGNDFDVQPFYFDFQNDCTDWQFVCGTVTTEEGRLVHSIDVYCEFSHQPSGYALFDNIAVFQNDDDSVVRYRYYTDDNTGYPIEQNATLAGLVHVKKVGSNYEVYEYNNERQIIRKANNRGELYEYIYNGPNIVSEIFYKFIVYNTPSLTQYPYSVTDPNSVITKTPQTKTDYAYTYGLCFLQDTYEAVYDGNNQVVEKPNASHIYNLANYETTSGSRIFGALLSEMNSLYETTQYFYDDANGRLLACLQYDKQEGTCYTYDAIGNLTEVRPATYDVSHLDYQPITNAESVSYTYNAQNRLDEIATGSTVYSFSYDSFGNTGSVSVGSSQLAEYEYNCNNGKLKQVTYGNGYAEKYEYDSVDNLKKVWYTESEQGINTVWTPAYEYTYTAYGQLYRFDNLLTGKGTVYKYDTSGKMTMFMDVDLNNSTNEFLTTLSYTENGQIQSLSYHYHFICSNATTTTAAGFYYSYSYDADGILQRCSLATETTAGGTNYTYDSFKRPTSKTVDFYKRADYYSPHFTNEVIYGYDVGYQNHTSGRVSAYVSNINGSNSATYRYLYDQKGNIVQIMDNNWSVLCRYFYDDLGQLYREDNQPLNRSYIYTYDNAGNRTSKTEYAYTLDALGTALSTQTYTYGNSDWGDLLTAVNGGQITYDAIGNPVSIVDGYTTYTLTWRGRRLMSLTKVNGRITEYWDYTYNDNGIRTGMHYRKTELQYPGDGPIPLTGLGEEIEKVKPDLPVIVTLDEYTAEYLLNGSQVVSEVVYRNGAESYRLIYLYEADGSPIGMQYHSRGMAANDFYTFWFEKNLQGDIVAVYDESGTKILSYTYDAWGNFTETLHSVNGNAQYALYNPFRYRGYRYDKSGFYYLQSRYYNPNWGRFLNADGYVSTGSGLLGYNMFAYCNNNPIMYVDPTGELWWIVAIVVVVAVVVIISTPSDQKQEPTQAQIDQAKESAQKAKPTIRRLPNEKSTVDLKISMEDAIFDEIANDYFYEELYNVALSAAQNSEIEIDNFELMSVSHIRWEFDIHRIGYHIPFLKGNCQVVELEVDENFYTLAKRALKAVWGSR